MNTKELVKYIKHYINQDKTKSAIMLTGKWGSGKSYFIQNELVPKLDKKCVVVSLYGLNNLFEVSRSLYFELKFKHSNKKSEKFSTSKLIAKTVAKGVASYFGVDLNLSEEDLNQLYSSVDVKDKLIIFEDVERSNIDILVFLGYVNNMVEQDGCKVLLVTNEDEFIEYEETEQQSNLYKNTYDLLDESCEKDDKKYTRKTAEYFRGKEKTISDTIQFRCDFNNTLKSIIKSFDNVKLNNFISDKYINEIEKICKSVKYFNLRAIIFACQKTVDIFNELKEIEVEFAKTIFYGIIAFSLRMKSGKQIKWIGNSLFSQYLGTEEFPLFHVCYHYIMHHTFLRREMETAQEDFKKYKLNFQNYKCNDDDLLVLYAYSIHTELEVIEAVKNIESKLKNNEIPYKEYGKIANSIISLSLYLDIDSASIKNYLIENLKGQESELEQYIGLMTGLGISNNEKREEYVELQEKMIESLNINFRQMLNFNDIDIDTFCERIYQLRNKYMGERKFASLINCKNFIEMIKHCSALQILNLRQAFDYMYELSNINDFFPNDKSMIWRLINEIKKLLEYEGFDRFQKLQCKWFIGDLENISQKLS